MKKRLIRIVSVCLSLIVFITSLNLSFLVKAEGTNPSVYINPSNTQAIYTYDGYYVVFNLNGSWTGGHNVGIQIYNTGNETIEDWTLESDYSNNISNIWNASVIENANGVTKLYHDTWNSVIYPNSCVEFGFSSNETFASFPTYFGMLGSEMTETNNELFSIDYNVTDEWEEGYTGEITITNNSENAIRNWALDFSCNNANISVWNARLISHEGNRVSVGNMGFNADINLGESVSFGFIVYNKTNNDEFYDYNLYESTVVSNEPQRELEPLGDIGEIYQKELHAEDVDFDETTGLQYVKNQILISAYMGTPREAVEEIVDEVGASIVGYIEITCDYQIEFSENKSLDELQEIVDLINGYSFISLASINLVSDIEESGFTNDAFYNDNVSFHSNYDKVNDMHYTNINSNLPDIDSETNPSGDDWGLEALNIPSAWSHITNSSTVKVGVYDNYFVNRYDGNYSELIFDDIKGNPEFNPTQYELEHGTHVSGIIGARSNNGNGISGVATDVRLYGYSYLSFGNAKCSSFGQKVAFTTLICNHIRIINISLGYRNNIIYAASDEDFSSYDKRALSFIEYDSKIIEEFLVKLQTAGYDYLLVCAAGNMNNKRYKITNENDYGIIETEDKNITLTSNLKAQYSYNLTAIDNPRIKSRIIVVGSVDKQFNVSNFSGAGDRIDVCAPGEDILSTIPLFNYSQGLLNNSVIYGYNVLSGTSMATPHISGLAALILQVNPDLNGAQVKKIICDDNNRRVLTKNADGLNISHNVPNGEKCILEALNFTNNSNIQGGHLTGTVKNTEGIIVHNVDICAIRDVSEGYSVDQDSFSYNFENGSNAEFNIFLPQGKYDIIFSAEGYLPNVIKNVEINVNENKTLPVELIKYTSNTGGNYVKGIVVDAATGEPIENATVGLRKNWGNVDGEYATSLEKGKMQTQTTHNGEFSIHALNGNYTASVSKDGYITGYYNVIPVGYDENNILRLALSPMLSEDEYRIILSWDQFPSDLDSHLTYTTDEGNKVHVYYGDKEGKYQNQSIAILDIDKVSGYGPETITINVSEGLLENGDLKYYIWNCTPYDGTISSSNAIIKIYKGNTLLYDPIYAPIDAIERGWQVFDITKNGIVMHNEYFSDWNIFSITGTD